MIKLNEKYLNITQFPNGETHIQGKDILSQSLKHDSQGKDFINNITFYYETDADLIQLMFVKRYLDSLQRKSSLTIAYMPYSRMDRIEGESVFTLKYISEFINSLNFDSIIIVEPHSDVTPALINNCLTTFPSVTILYGVKQLINFNSEKDFVYFPDASSQKRYSSKIGNCKSLVGLKHRDFDTGKITNLEVIGNTSNTPFKVIMIDDLCSYGGTFIMGAKKLKELGASEIYLVTGHAENSIYLGDIFKTNLIDKVFTTDSIIKEEKNNKIKIYSLNKKGGLLN